MSSDAVVHRFYKRAESHVATARDLADFFVYFLTVEKGESVASTSAIANCYDACDLAAPSWLASHLSKGVSSNPKRFVKRDGGYRLENGRRTEIAKLFGQDELVIQTSGALSKLEDMLAPGPKRDFLHETISCFSVGANRAAIVMCWNLALHHLQDYLFADNSRLATFNLALGAVYKVIDARIDT